MQKYLLVTEDVFYLFSFGNVIDVNKLSHQDDQALVIVKNSQRGKSEKTIQTGWRNWGQVRDKEGQKSRWSWGDEIQEPETRASSKQGPLS